MADSDYPLSEVAALIDAEAGRKTLNDWIVRRLSHLTPSAALHALPAFRWHAIYTVNFDTLVEQAYAATTSPLQQLRPIYSNRDRITGLDRDTVPLYKLHGCVSRPNSDEGRLVLTQDDFARVEESRKRLFNRLLDSLVDLPVLYVGFARADPDFARVLAEVDKAVSGLVDLSRSYALQPRFVDAEAKRAEMKKVTLLDLGAQDFFQQLSTAIPEPARLPTASESPIPVSRLTARRPGASNSILRALVDDFEILDDRLLDERPDAELFFKGSQPSWGDIAAGFDAERDLLDPLLEAALVDTDIDSATVNLVFLHSEAGGGKTTLLRRAGAELATTWDAVVLSLQPFGELELLNVERLASALDERVYILVDDASRLSGELRNFVSAATRARMKVTIVAAARTNEWRESQDARLLTPQAEFEIGPLTSGEIDHILDVLEEHDQLFHLKDADRPTQRKAFEERADKQLLVALREATEGKHFDEIVVDEYERIPGDDARRAYLYVAALHRFGLLTRAAVLHRALAVPLADLGARVFAPAAKIILAQDISDDPEPYYRTRHPLIAEIVFDRMAPSERERLDYYISIIRELDLGYASDADTYRRLSRSLNRYLLRDFESSSHKREIMQEIEALDPSDAYVQQHAAMMELALGNLKAAGAHIARAISARPHDTAIRDTEGRILLAAAEQETSLPRKRAKLAEAETIFTRNISRRPGEPYGYRHLAETYWLKMEAEPDESKKAQVLALAYHSLEEGLDNAIDTPMLVQYLAELENRLGNRSEARMLLDGALKGRPGDVRMRLLAARLASLDKDSDAQIAQLRAGLSVSPDAWELHFALAQVLARMQPADIDEVTRHFRSAVLAPVRRYRPRLAYAAWLFSLGRYEDADEQFAQLEQVEVSSRERREPRTFPFLDVPGRHEGRITRLSYHNGHVEYDGGATRLFFRRDDTPSRGAGIRPGALASYEVSFNLKGPVAVRLRAIQRPQSRRP